MFPVQGAPEEKHLEAQQAQCGGDEPAQLPVSQARGQGVPAGAPGPEGQGTYLHAQGPMPRGWLPSGARACMVPVVLKHKAPRMTHKGPPTGREAPQESRPGLAVMLMVSNSRYRDVRQSAWAGGEENHKAVPSVTLLPVVSNFHAASEEFIKYIII